MRDNRGLKLADKNDDRQPDRPPVQPDRRQVVAGGAAGTLAYLMSLGETRAQSADGSFLGAIMPVAFNFAPRGWALCNGQFLAINQNAALFSLLGTTYGGNGVQTFALPDLRGRTPVGYGPQPQGALYGTESHTLTISETPSHNHLVNVRQAVAASGRARLPPAGNMLASPNPPAATMYGNPTNPVVLSSVNTGTAGGSQPHSNLQPYLVVNFIIALQGIFPSRN